MPWGVYESDLLRRRLILIDTISITSKIIDTYAANRIVV